MNYRQAQKVKVGDTLLIKSKNYLDTRVFEIKKDDQTNMIFFRCTDGWFSYNELSSQMSIEEITKRIIKNPRTKVYIDHNNETGEWLYSVVVVNSGGYWLDSFYTKEEAEQYIKENKLVMIGKESKDEII